MQCVIIESDNNSYATVYAFTALITVLECAPPTYKYHSWHSWQTLQEDAKEAPVGTGEDSTGCHCPLHAFLGQDRELWWCQGWFSPWEGPALWLPTKTPALQPCLL